MKKQKEMNQSIGKLLTREQMKKVSGGNLPLCPSGLAPFACACIGNAMQNILVCTIDECRAYAGTC